VSGGIFLDSAGSSLPPEAVLDTMISHIRREAQIGGYLAQAERETDLAAVRTDIATLLNATPDTIALSDSASRSWSDCFYAVPLAAGDRILVSEVDYSSNAMATIHRARATGATVEVMPSDPTGAIDLEALDDLLDERVRLVSIVHVPTNGGLVNPAAEATRLAHDIGAFVLLDACQSAGQLPLDVAKLGVDALSATGRKWLRGPRGTGFLYLRRELLETLEPVILDNRRAEWTGPNSYLLATDAARFEFWEHSVAARLGLGAAVRHLLDSGPDLVYAEIAARADYLRTALAAVPGVTVRDRGTVRSGIVSFTVSGFTPELVRDLLLEADITVTVSPARSTLRDMTTRGLDGVVRASPHVFVSYPELDYTVDTITHLATRS
jgi:selenocysteine lyase/cysteine desulfurase